MTRISSRMTFYSKRVFPVVWFGFLGIFACAMAFCLLMLYVTWSRVAVGVKSAFWAVAIAAGFLQVFGFEGDAYLGGRNLLANVVSSAVLLVGLGLSGLGTYRGRAGLTRARAQEV